MTRYTVVWDAAVEAQFTSDWVNGDGQVRAALTEIANWIDQNLAEDRQVRVVRLLFRT